MPAKNIGVIHGGISGYLLTHYGPWAQQVVEHFGSQTLPLPWTLLADPEMIKIDLERRNPDVRFVIEGDE